MTTTDTQTLTLEDYLSADRDAPLYLMQNGGGAVRFTRGKPTSARERYNHWRHGGSRTGDIIDTARNFRITKLGDYELVADARTVREVPGPGTLYRISWDYRPSYGGKDSMEYARLVRPGEDGTLEERYGKTQAEWTADADARQMASAARVAELRDALNNHIVTGYRCDNCDHIHEDEPEIDPRYECPECGTEFSRSESDYDSHRSSCCGKFSSKIANTTCPECQEGVDEFVDVECVTLSDGEIVPVEDLDPEQIEELVSGE